MTSAVDKAIFEAKARGLLPGVYGRLKDLATIDEKYNIAATASTSFIDHWIVDTETTGKELVTFLEANHLPLECILCINKMGNLGSLCKEPFQAPKNSLRIFDLLNIRHPETVPCFYKAYYDTLYVDNLAIASQVAYGGPSRYRVVTRMGDIVEMSGSFYGGGAKLSRGKYNSQASQNTCSGVSGEVVIDI